MSNAKRQLADIQQRSRPLITDLELEVSGPDAHGFFTCNIAWEDVGDYPSDPIAFTSYNRERAQAYALQYLADKLITESRKEIKL